MYGAIIGDIAGSVIEFEGIKRKDLPIFMDGCDITDDTIMTIAVARALMQWRTHGGDLHYLMTRHMQALGHKYPHPLGAYGFGFKRWLMSRHPKPYGSFGNGSAMRVSPCGLMADSLESALELAKISAEVTHDHPEGIKGAQATAAAIYLAKTRHSKEEIREYIHENFYPMDRTLEEIRPGYSFDGSCQGSVPESIIAFMESDSYEDAICNVISLGGDADTMGAITGSIAWSYYRFREGSELPFEMEALKQTAKEYIYEEFLETVEEFDRLCQPTFPD